MNKLLKNGGGAVGPNRRKLVSVKCVGLEAWCLEGGIQSLTACFLMDVL